MGRWAGRPVDAGAGGPGRRGSGGRGDGGRGDGAAGVGETGVGETGVGVCRARCGWCSRTPRTGTSRAGPNPSPGSCPHRWVRTRDAPRTRRRTLGRRSGRPAGRPRVPRRRQPRADAQPGPGGRARGTAPLPAGPPRRAPAGRTRTRRRRRSLHDPPGRPAADRDDLPARGRRGRGRGRTARGPPHPPGPLRGRRPGRLGAARLRRDPHPPGTACTPHCTPLTAAPGRTAARRQHPLTQAPAATAGAAVWPAPSRPAPGRSPSTARPTAATSRFCASHPPLTPSPRAQPDNSRLQPSPGPCASTTSYSPTGAPPRYGTTPASAGSCNRQPPPAPPDGHRPQSWHRTRHPGTHPRGQDERHSRDRTSGHRVRMQPERVQYSLATVSPCSPSM